MVWEAGDSDSLSEMKSQMRATAPLRTSHGSLSVHNINNQDTLLPGITADISGQKGLYKRGNATQDSQLSTQERRLAGSVWKPQRALVWKGGMFPLQ